MAARNEHEIYSLTNRFPAQGITPQMVIAACLSEDLSTLAVYHALGVDFNKIYDSNGFPLLHLAIFYNKPKTFTQLIEYGINIETTSLDGGTTALNWAAMINKPYYANQLIELGANINTRANDGYTPLNNALYFENYSLAKSLLKIPTIDVNIPNHEGLTPVYFAFTDKQWDVLESILTHPNYDATFNNIALSVFDLNALHNYLDQHVNDPHPDILEAFHIAKLFGFKFDFNGCLPLTQLHDTHQHACFPYGGYSNRLGAYAMADSYHQFFDTIINDSHIPLWAYQAFVTVNDSLTFSANIFDPKSYYNKIVLGETVIVPTGWDGHSIVFVFHQDKLYRCNRGENSDGIHGIEEFIISKPTNLTESMISHMLTIKGTPQYLQYDIIDILGLQKVGEIENPTQIAGNCVWTSLEAGLEASLLANFMYQGVDSHTAHKLAKDSYNLWKEFDLTYTLKDAIEHQELLLENEIYDDILIKMLENHHNPTTELDIQNAIVALYELDKPSVFETFDQEIGQILIKYNPHSSNTISYMQMYTPSYSDYLTYWLSKSPLTLQEQIKAKEYYDFLKACDDYQQKNGHTVINLDEIINVSFSNSLDNLFNNILSDTTQTASFKPSPVTPFLSTLIPLEEFSTGVHEHFA